VRVGAAYGPGVTSFVLETYVPDGSQERFTSDVDGLRRAAGSSVPAGAVRHLASYLVPGDEMGFHLIEADDAGAVERMADRAGIEAERIVEAVDIEPDRWVRAGEPPRGGPE
jgi:hypothetical protein